MTSTESPSRNELLELAPLDALGLLDEFEEHRFDTGFAEAPSEVQSEVRDLQAAVAAEFGSAAADTPDRALRYRVLASLSAAIEADDASCAPIAAIGDPTAYRRRTTTDAASEHDSIIIADAVRRDRAARSSLIWRAAALTLGCGLLVVLYFANNLADTTRDLARLAFSNEVRLDLRERVGFSYLNYLDSSTAQVISLAGTAGDGAGVLFIEGKNGTALFVAFDLPQAGGPFTLVAIDKATGVSIELATVAIAQQFTAIEFAMGSVAVGSTFRLLDGSGGIVLATTV